MSDISTGAWFELSVDVVVCVMSSVVTIIVSAGDVGVVSKVVAVIVVLVSTCVCATEISVDVFAVYMGTVVTESAKAESMTLWVKSARA